MLANSNYAKSSQQRGSGAQTVLRSARPAFAVAPTTAAAGPSPTSSPRDLSARCASPIPLLRKTRWEEGESNSEEMSRYLEENGSFPPLAVDPATQKQQPSRVFGTQRRETRRRSGVPVYVMLPLDTIKVVRHPDGSSESCIQNEISLDIALQTLKSVGVQGVMIDVWWGIVERVGPGHYDFSAYSTLIHKVAAAGLKLQAVMSFHAAGSNVGDTCTIALPDWVHDVGDRNEDIFFTDRGPDGLPGTRNRECISIGCADEPVFWGRTPLQVYEAFMRAFCEEFQHLFGDVISEITVGCGPAGEARYPAYPEGDRRWRFPGVGEFQCYDKYMLADLRRAANAAGNPAWGKEGGPHDSGTYCCRAEHTGFFHPDCGNWRSDYGKFFLNWYSGKLLRYVERMVAMGNRVLAEPRRPRALASMVCLDCATERITVRSPVKVGIKLAGVHWCYRTPSHAAELTAGYYNIAGRDGYAPFFRMLRQHDASVSFTCVEMRDCEHPPDSGCSPEELLKQIIDNSLSHGVPLTGENALQRYDHMGLRRIRESALANRRGGIHQLTFLRMGTLMFDHWSSFTHLVQELQRDDLD
eukprot:jgi/Ulvmu1/8522/UM044_0056.1